MSGRRGNGEGSIYQRASDGRWLGVALLGYDSDGHPKRKTVSARTRAEVVQKLRSLQRQLDDGLPAPDTQITVAQLLGRWHDNVLRHQVAKSAADNYKSVADHHIVPSLGRKKVARLTPSDIDRLLSHKVDSGLAVSTVRRIRSVLSQALDQAMRWGVVNRNVASLTRGPKAQRQEGRTLTPREARQLLSSLEGHRNEALYALMLSTGLRRGEALGLKWSDVDLDTGLLLVRRQLKREGGKLVTSDTKTTRSRRAVNLPGPMVDSLRAHRARQASERLALGEAWRDTDYVFTTTVGTPIDPRNLYREFRSICRSAELGNWHPHELRHSAASLMLAQGVKLQVVSEVLGHSSIRMTADVYGHILAPDRKAAADAMTDALWA
ncbi:MAG TPA: tyrosine-type recombinase/integrase [Acidimicrobiales bacterium]|jgi:integrase